MRQAVRQPTDGNAESRFLFPRSGRCEGFAEVSGASVELRRFEWGGQVHEGSFALPKRFVELTDIHAEGGYGAAESRWHRLGMVRFYPGLRRFYSRWSQGRQTSLLCALDLPRLTGVELEIPDARLAECGNLRNGYLQTLLVRIRDEILKPGFASDLIVESACVAVAAEIVQHFATPAPPARSSCQRVDDRLVAELAARIRAGEAPASLAELARQEGITARHYARLFRTTTGESIGRFCSRQLILRGQDLLADRSLLTKEVAHRCGFANTAAFTRAFRRAVGLSPRQYRESLGRPRNS